MNQKYLTIYNHYKASLPTSAAIKRQIGELEDWFAERKISEEEYTVRIEALLILEQQHTEAEARRARWVNAGQEV